MTICELCPVFSIIDFLIQENIDVRDEKGFLFTLAEYREKLELDNHVICDDEELKKILEEGLHIHRIIVKERLYGKD